MQAQYEDAIGERRKPRAEHEGHRQCEKALQQNEERTVDRVHDSSRAIQHKLAVHSGAAFLFVEACTITMNAGPHNLAAAQHIYPQFRCKPPLIRSVPRTRENRWPFPRTGHPRAAGGSSVLQNAEWVFRGGEERDRGAPLSFPQDVCRLDPGSAPRREPCRNAADPGKHGGGKPKCKRIAGLQAEKELIDELSSPEADTCADQDTKADEQGDPS